MTNRLLLFCRSTVVRYLSLALSCTISVLLFHFIQGSTQQYVHLLVDAICSVVSMTAARLRIIQSTRKVSRARAQHANTCSATKTSCHDCITKLKCRTNRQYSFFDVPTAPVAGVGKEGRALIGSWGYLNRTLPFILSRFSVVSAIGNVIA